MSPETPCMERIEGMVRAQAARTPDAIAVECGGESLRYGELVAAAERAAARLGAEGVARGTLVGIHLERSPRMLVALLAVMRAGGTWIPLDPDFPRERLRHMVGDSGLGFVVSQAALAGELPEGAYRTLLVEDLAGDAAASTARVVESGATGDDLAYVLYTSGSTGLPKGVAVEHRSVANFLSSMQREPGIGGEDRLLAVTTLSFDIAVLELFLPLVSGATVVIATREQAIDGEALRDLVESRGISILQGTPSTWRLLLDAGWSGKAGFRALCGGEALPLDLAHRLAARCELWNMYGPTETTVWSTVWRVPADCRQVLVGRPIANTSIHVLDRSGRPVPVGIPGEICIGGAGVARGYLHRDALTAERFVADPFSGVPGARLYRTGDQGRLLPDGNLECRGRLDGQVKVRGYRVEPGEIEQVLLSAGGVRRAVVTVREDVPGDMRLVGYVVADADGGVDEAALFEHLRGLLPAYMVPQHLVLMDAIPLLPNGKVDRRSLPPPLARRAPADVDMAALPPAVRYLVTVCSEVLGGSVAPDDNFFDAGGHSMLAVRLVNRVQQDTGVRLGLLALASQTLGQLAAALAPALDGDRAETVPAAGPAALRHA